MLIEKQWTQVLPTTIDKAWDFFSKPSNLDNITPDDMAFEVLTDLGDELMYPGMIIQYKISPFAGIKMSWVTEITQVEDKTYFIDEQRFGPYAFWHHQHHFEQHEQGVLMTDILHYKLPMGFLGQLFGGKFVSDKINQIFDYRYKTIEKLFG